MVFPNKYNIASAASEICLSVVLLLFCADQKILETIKESQKIQSLQLESGHHPVSSVMIASVETTASVIVTTLA